MAVYSDMNPKFACWTSSEKIERYEAMTFSSSPKFATQNNFQVNSTSAQEECKTVSLVALSSGTTTTTPQNGDFRSEGKEGEQNAGSRETTPRSDSEETKKSGSPSLGVVPNESDRRIEMTEDLPFICLTSGRRVKKEDVIDNVKAGLLIYHQNRALSKIQITKDMVYFSKAKSRELGIEFAISDLKDCLF
jgi:hypothetical protein